MGRKRSKFHHLPPHMVARVRGKTTYYFYDQRPKKPAEISLGKVYADALQKWAQLECDHHTATEIITFKDAADRYQQQVIPLKKPGTQLGNIKELANLLKFFGDPPAPLSKIKPVNIAQYIDWRTKRGTTARVSANREVALFSHIWNKARTWGYTDQANPCRGVERHSEKGRDVYIEDDVFAAVWKVADQPLRDALDLAYLTGQRVTDTRMIDEKDIRDGFLHIKQGKTDAKRRIEVTGELLQVIERIKARKRSYQVYSTRLLVNEDGFPLMKDALRYRFDQARDAAGIEKSAFQFRDIRAKAGTDKTDSTGDIRQAQKQLGHASLTMTEHYVRSRRGEKVTPTR